ncbi:MAG: hypothetical protein M1827_007204 [Pycnora praestabilis]|nr:MAG: hypothetical protein M1827_007204 [Pycnora praestabilis]
MAGTYDHEYSMKDMKGVQSVDYGSPSPERVESLGDRDDHEMAYMGKKQQLKRNFGFMSMLGFTCTLMATWEGMTSVFLYGFENGGPGGLIYGFIICWIGSFAVVASLAELASMYPTAGGQYHWVSMLAPERFSNILSYVTGSWITVIGWQAACASGAYLGGTIIQGLLVLNYPSYDFHRWHGTLMFYAVILLALIVNTWMARHLPKLEGFILVVHIFGFFGVLIPLVYLAPHGNASEVFGTFLNEGGWSSQGLSFFVGIMTGVYSFGGTEGAVHMCEEIANASTVVPQTMIWTVVLNGILGFAMMIALLFCLGDIDQALKSPTGYPFIEIFYQATNSTGGATAMTSVIVILCIVATFALLATASRMMWAFARDNGLPFSRYLAKVEPRTALPLYSIALSTLISLLLGLINIGSTAAFNAIVSLIIAATLISYGIPICLLLIRRIRGDQLRWGPWKLGRLGVVTNIIGLIYIFIATFFSFWPQTAQVDAVDMNWSVVVLGGVMILSMVFYFIYGRKQYKGPIIEVRFER